MDGGFVVLTPGAPVRRRPSRSVKHGRSFRPTGLAGPLLGRPGGRHFGLAPCLRPGEERNRQLQAEKEVKHMECMEQASCLTEAMANGTTIDTTDTIMMPNG